MSEGNWASKFKQGLFDNLGFVMAFLVAFVYLFYGLITLEGSGKTLAEILISSFVIWLVGYSIGQLLTLQGLLIGEKDKTVQNTKENHARILGDIGSDIVYLEFYCTEQTTNALKTARASRLSRVGLKYEDYFTNEGEVKEDNIYIAKSNESLKEKRNVIKRKAINEAIYIKVTPLTVETLTTDNGNKYDPYDYGQDKFEYLKSIAWKTAIAKIAIGVGFGYYAINLIQDFEWGYLIWTSIQIGIFLILGSISLFKSYLFVTDTQRQNRIKKINKLEQFKGTNKSKYKDLVEKAVPVIVEQTIKEELEVEVLPPLPKNMETLLN